MSRQYSAFDHVAIELPEQVVIRISMHDILEEPPTSKYVTTIETDIGYVAVTLWFQHDGLHYKLKPSTSKRKQARVSRSKFKQYVKQVGITLNIVSIIQYLPAPPQPQSMLLYNGPWCIVIKDRLGMEHT